MLAKSFAANAAAMGALALLASCSTNKGDEVSVRTGEAREAIVTMRGINAEGVSSALLTLSDVTVTADGRELPTRVDGRTVDFAEQNELVAAKFTVPPDAQNVQVSLNFDDYGGYELAQGSAGALDARGTRVLLDVPAKELAESGKAQVSLDLSRSLIERGGADLMLAPHFQLTY